MNASSEAVGPDDKVFESSPEDIAAPASAPAPLAAGAAVSSRSLSGTPAEANIPVLGEVAGAD